MRLLFLPLVLLSVFPMALADTPAARFTVSDLGTISPTAIPQGPQAVIRWAEANGRRICGPGREVYLHYERGGDPNAYVTEIQYPVTTA